MKEFREMKKQTPGLNVVTTERVELTPFEIKRAGEKIRIALLKLGRDEGLTAGQAAVLFNVTESAVRKQIDRHDISCCFIASNHLQLLKKSRVVAQKANKALFIPRVGLRDLMRVIGTPEAREAYHQVFDDAEALHAVQELLALKNSALDQEQRQRQIAEAKCDAVTNLLLKRARRAADGWASLEFENDGTDALGQPRFNAILMTKESSATLLANDHYKVQHGAKTVHGSCKTMRKRLQAMGIKNRDTLGKADALVDASSIFLNHVMPRDPAIFVQSGRHVGFMD